MNILESINIPEEVFEKWDKSFLSSYDLIYLDEGLVTWPEDILVMPLKELQANPTLYTMNVRTTFTTWHVQCGANQVAVIENEQFDNLTDDLKQQLLEMQHKLGRGNLYEFHKFNPYLDVLNEQERLDCIDHLNKMSFHIDHKKWTALRLNHWKRLPWDVRKGVLADMAVSYSDDAINQKVDSETFNLPPSIQSYVNKFPTENGANCFATALSGITADRHSVDWIIRQWIHPNTFLQSLNQRNYVKINEVKDWKSIELKEKDVIVWVNKNLTPIHATAALNDSVVFNKDGQTMFNPWLVRDFHELAASWDEEMSDGGQIHHYRKVIS